MPPAQLPTALVVTADDFGFGVSTSRGIIRAHRAGIVTSTSLMAVTGDHAAGSVALLADAPALEVGMHLVLTGPAQRPLAATRSSGLVGRDGAFHPLKKLLFLSLCERLDYRGVLDEICAQAEKCRGLLGRSPAYVDGHHHAHQLPVVREALVIAMRVGVLPRVARCTTEAASVRKNVRGCAIRRAVMHRIGSAARPGFQEAGVQTNDSCFGIISPADLRKSNPWDHYLGHLPPTGTVEWFVHPGEADETLAGRDTYRAERVIELEALIRFTQQDDWPRWKSILRTKCQPPTYPPTTSRRT